jgi:hypothetical protein
MRKRISSDGSGKLTKPSNLFKKRHYDLLKYFPDSSGICQTLFSKKNIMCILKIFQIHRQTFLSSVSYTGDMGISFYPRTFLPPVAALSDSINTHYEAGKKIPDLYTLFP